MKNRKKYIRRNWREYKRLGRGNKKKQIWRRPRGRDNKMRERKKGRAGRPELGERKPKELRGRILGLKPVIVRRAEDLKNLGKGEIVIVGKLGKRKRMEILKEVEKMNLPILKPGKRI